MPFRPVVPVVSVLALASATLLCAACSTEEPEPPPDEVENPFEIDVEQLKRDQAEMMGAAIRGDRDAIRNQQLDFMARNQQIGAEAAERALRERDRRARRERASQEETRRAPGAYYPGDVEDSGSAWASSSAVAMGGALFGGLVVFGAVGAGAYVMLRSVDVEAQMAEEEEDEPFA
jgi:hypothetical protein